MPRMGGWMRSRLAVFVIVYKLTFSHPARLAGCLARSRQCAGLAVEHGSHDIVRLLELSRGQHWYH